MSRCDKCIHKLICEHVERIDDNFKMEEKVASCALFYEEPEKEKKRLRSAEHSFDHTIEMMRSPDYKERFKAEYYQTKIRYEKLKAFCNKIEAAEVTTHEKAPYPSPLHDCPLHMLRDQQAAMGHYLHVLEIRAVIENIEL